MRLLVMSANDIPSFLPSWQPDPSADNLPLGEDRTRLEKERISRIPDLRTPEDQDSRQYLIWKIRLLHDVLCHRWVGSVDSSMIITLSLSYVVNEYDPALDDETGGQR
jgi:hypothetical protein